MNSVASCNQNLPKLQTNENGDNFISLYSGELTSPAISKNIARVRAAFPSLALEYFSLLTDMVIEAKFSDDRLKDAVNHVIKNCIYPHPTIANFLSFDKKRRLYTKQQMISMMDASGAGNQKDGPAFWAAYETIEIKGTRFWYSKAEGSTL